MKYINLIIGIVLTSLAKPAFGATFTTILDNGPTDNRVDVVFLGDGYTAADLATGIYDDHVDRYLDYWFSEDLLTDPFFRYRNYFNVHTVEVVSQESGADVPTVGIFRDTALDARYYFDGATEQLLYIDEGKANSILNEAFATADLFPELQFVTVNDDRYGGGSSAYSVFSGGNAFAPELALHETGHTFSDLADEYGGITSPYSGPEPPEVNVTTDPSGEKWSHWLGYDQPGVGVIDAYEGARYYEEGLYRPSPNSKMRSLYQPFDAVSREQIILDIYEWVDPLDAWLDNSTVLFNPDELFVEVIDESTISLEWFVNDVKVPTVSGETFDLAALDALPGEYTIAVRAFDSTAFDPVDGWVRIDQNQLEQFVYWDIVLTAAAVDAISVPESRTWIPLGLLSLWFVIKGQRLKGQN